MKRILVRYLHGVWPGLRTNTLVPARSTPSSPLTLCLLIKDAPFISSSLSSSQTGIPQLPGWRGKRKKENKKKKDKPFTFHLLSYTRYLPFARPEKRFQISLSLFFFFSLLSQEGSVIERNRHEIQSGRYRSNIPIESHRGREYRE